MTIFNPFRPRALGRYTSDGESHNTWMDHVRKRTPGSVLLWCAAVLLLGLAVAQGYVSWRAQYAFIFAAKHASIPSALEALGLDTGAVIFALLGLSKARRGRPAKIERILNVACALGSMTMNLLGADLSSPRSVAVYVLPALLYAACSDRLIATAAEAAGVPPTSVWNWLGTAFLYGLRAVVALPSTASGLRRRLLQLTPLPEAPQDAPATHPEIAPEAHPEPALAVAPVTALPGAPGKRVRRAPAKRTRSRTRSALVTALDAEREFMDEMASGAVPSQRQIRTRLHVGQNRAREIHEHLESVVSATRT